ncbi:microfibril-associated glycoprotein 4 [Microcaecilia unicolor]|uniref:Microfibril-associated glycoprotein 4-like n=1 Tax=Microcaecilia unicolor TaxID=1415580 RepID=A0A6P7YCT7_9AMPH|nr:microfibril-associated glycoprotein 4-like [Microcaecilia unicolor]
MKILLLLLLWQPCSSSEAPQVYKMERKSLINSTENQDYPLDCEVFQKRGYITDGVYVIYPRGPNWPVPVYCDMSNDGGGWTVFQKRFDGSTDFHLDWHHYKDGFGQADKEYWLGLENLRLMTLKKKYKLRVDLITSDNQVSVEYAAFSLSPYAINEEEDNYTLYVSGFQGGEAGDSFSSHSGQPFSTFDRDNDGHIQNCAEYSHGGFWYHSNGCFSANLNGCYRNHQMGCSGILQNSISWESWNTNSTISFSQMKIKATSGSDSGKTRSQDPENIP